ncbi:short-chain type dehydrogenase reductase [Lichtheimia corymbifera JMRC:FSU:9682]|uniref:Short-chain type dehydrogenase reductase n=1 Tax=Lichtheimia corymbifera JMRC:FSU:9682 TaxID=1263082 RepID=A0A068S7I9_9FUNG|nr:short-chain type dehydrogenase reductase [Lichtheimia corymbifera JMRC:FSU:9682]
MTAEKNTTHDAFRLDGKNCIVTGGARGIGHGIVRAFAQAGASKIAILDVRDELGKEAAKEVGNEFPSCQVKYYHLDISNFDEVQALYEQIEADFGAIHVQVSNAGIAEYKPALEHTPESWHKIMRVNLDGTFWTAQAAAKRMVKQGNGGSIILIGSISGHVINRPDAQPGMTHYCVSKGAIVHMAKALGVEWAEYGIRVNSLSPGNIVTPIAPSDDKTVAYFRHATPLARMGTPNEIGRPAVYLASDASSFQSCTDVLIDGGLCAW